MPSNIIYSDGANISVISCAEGVPLDEVVKRSVPLGVPYIIADRATLPSAEFPPEMWEVGMSSPDGVGGSKSKISVRSLSPEEQRAQMPDKTPREFRDILTDMGIFPHMVVEKINEIPFDLERQKALNAWDVSTSISRTDPYVDMIGAMFDKTPADIDAAWSS